MSAVLAAALALAAPAAAQRPRTLGSAELSRLGDDIGRVLGTAPWGIRTNVAGGGSPESQNAAVRRKTPRVVAVVRRYERRVSAGPCKTALHRLAAAYARGATVTTATATAFNLATMRASQRTISVCD